jgi:glycosyltransferase involved in cell wall biosynthesis
MARIGIDARYLENENTGVGRYSYNLLVHLLEEDRKNTYSVFLRDDYAGRLPTGQNVTYRRVPYKPVSLSSLVAMSPRVRGLGLDLWHTHFPVAPLFPGAPVLVTVHDLQPIRVPTIGDRRPLPLRAGYRVFYPVVYRYTLSRASAILAVSLATKKEIRDCFGIPREKIHVIHEALDDRFQGRREPADRARQGDGAPLPGRFLLYVGATLPHKNIGNMLRGFARAREEPGQEDLHLVMAGRESRFDRDWIELAERLGIRDRIQRIGYVGQEDLPRLYEKAAALFYVSCYEGFGFPPLEAMRNGTPVIAAFHSSLPEVVGAAGVFVAPDDVEGIAGAIVEVLGNPGLRERLKEHGRKNLERFSWKTAARKTLDVYAKILGATPEGREPGPARGNERC